MWLPAISMLRAAAAACRAAAAHAGTVIVLAPDPPAGAAAHAGPDWATERQVASLLALKVCVCEPWAEASSL